MNAIMMITMTIAIAMAIVLTIPTQNALASHSSDAIACEGDGLYDGKNNPISQKLCEMCGDTYYDAFIEGCMKADNSREVCEQATDAE